MLFAVLSGISTTVFLIIFRFNLFHASQSEFFFYFFQMSFYRDDVSPTTTISSANFSGKIPSAKQRLKF